MERDRGAQAAPTLAQVVGENVRRLREERELTQDELVSRWRSIGLAWPRSKLSAFEGGGRKSVPLADAMLIAVALDVNLQVLLEGDGDVSLGPGGGAAPLALLREWLSGRCETDQLLTQLVDEEGLFDDGASSADTEMAERVGVQAKDVADIARVLWGRTLTAERDRRVDEMQASSMAERRAYRGHVTRQLESEINRAFARRAMGYGDQ